MNIYKKINGSDYGKVFVVGDIHGCYDLLMNELNKVEFDFETDLLISVGDLIDRGDKNIECLQLLEEKWFACVQGNHEHMAINAVVNNNRAYFSCWVMNGGKWSLYIDYDEDIELKRLLKIADEQPLIIELNTSLGETIVIAHADYPSDQYTYGKDVNAHDVVWSRSRFENSDSSSIGGADMFIFGHTPVEDILRKGNRLYIDTGAVFNGNLTLIRLE